MRIAQIAPLIESVPPRLYGGTERIVSYLTEALVMEGHEVTLFASGQSITSAKLVPCSPQALRLNPAVRDPIPYYMVMVSYGSKCEVDDPVGHVRLTPKPDVDITMTHEKCGLQVLSEQSCDTSFLTTNGKSFDRCSRASRAGCLGWMACSQWHLLGVALRCTMRDLPGSYGPRTTCYNRFVRLPRAGIWETILNALAAAHDAAIQMIDTSIVRVHQHAACIFDSAKQASAGQGLDLPASFTLSSMERARLTDTHDVVIGAGDTLATHSRCAQLVMKKYVYLYGAAERQAKISECVTSGGQNY